MRYKISLEILLVVSLLFFVMQQVNNRDDNNPQVLSAVLYKDPNCACCDKYAKEFEKEFGVKLHVVNSKEMYKVKKRFAVPDSLQSCHTLSINGKVIEGHIPFDVTSDLLSGKLSAEKISLPGMPVGVPGMPGDKNEKYKIYGFDDPSEIFVIKEI